MTLGVAVVVGATIIFPYIYLGGHLLFQEPKDWLGILVGHGLEGSLFYFGDFKWYPGNLTQIGTLVKNSNGTVVAVASTYSLEMAWTLCAGLTLLLPLLAIIYQIGSDNLEDEPNFAFSSLVFSGYDHNIQSREGIRRVRAQLRTDLEDLVRFKKEKEAEVAGQSENVRRSKNTDKVVVGLSATFALFTVNLSGFHLLFRWELKNLNTSLPEQLLVLPLVIAAVRLTVSKLLLQIVRCEGHARRSRVFSNHFWRVQLTYLSYCLLFVIETAYIDSDNLLWEPGCKETVVGIFFHRILIGDFILSLIFSLMYPYLRMQGRRCLSKREAHCRGELYSPFEDGQIVDNQFVGSNGAGSGPVDAKSREVPPTKSAFARSDHAKDKEDPKYYEDPSKTEFRISDHVADLVYRQTLVFCGTFYSPSLVAVGLALHMMIFFAQYCQVLFLSKRVMRPVGIPEQRRYFHFSMLLSVLVLVVSFLVYLRSVPNCGNRVNSGLTMWEDWSRQLQRLPNSMLLVIEYLCNQMSLWIVIGFLGVWAANLRRAEKAFQREIKAVTVRFKMETHLQKKIIRAYDIDVGLGELRGRRLFASWVEEMGEIGVKYIAPLAQVGYGDLVKLCKLTPLQVSGLLARLNCPPSEIKHILVEIERKQLQLL